MAKKYVNPARAGMIRSSTTSISRSTGKPRASGDDPGSEMRTGVF